MSYRDEVLLIDVFHGDYAAQNCVRKSAEISAHADARIAELVELLTECRDCVASDINHTLAQFHEPAAVDYLHALLMRVDAALARAGNGVPPPLTLSTANV